MGWRVSLSKSAFKMLERYAVKVARTVLRGGSGSNAIPLPDHADPAKTMRGRRLDSHRQIGFVHGFEFWPFRERASSLQPPVPITAVVKI